MEQKRRGTKRRTSHTRLRNRNNERNGKKKDEMALNRGRKMNKSRTAEQEQNQKRRKLDTPPELDTL